MKWPEIPQIMCSGTDHKHTVLVGAIRGHLGAIRGHLGVIWGHLEANQRPQRKMLGADLRPISPCFLAQSGLKYPKLCTLGLIMNT